MTASVIDQAYADGIRPDPVLLVSEWADQYRILPNKSSAEPGRWRTARTPYLREIMDCLSTTSPIEEVVFMKAAQIGGSEVLLNWMGYIIDHAPAPSIIVEPTVELAKRFSRQRVDPLINDTPRIADKVESPRSRSSGNTALSKEYAGGVAIITGANSAVGLRSMPAQNALMDEIDGWPGDVDEEGSPIVLVEARQRTFARKKRAKVSTPTIAGRSAIEEAYVASDQRRYYVPCPDCGEMQPLEFGRLKWTEFSLAPEEAVYECRACLFKIPHHLKTQLLERGEWRAENPGASPKIRGYHLSALYAPIGWISWGEIAVQFARDHRHPEKHRGFVNTVLGETWKEKGDAPEWKSIYHRRETYPFGEVPEGGIFLTAGVDVQKDRLVYEVVAWGRGKASWSIDWNFIAGDTANLKDGPWTQLSALLERKFTHARGGELSIRMLAVDSGYNTQTVYTWTKQYPISRVVAVKGRDGALLVGAPQWIEVSVSGKKLKRGGARVCMVAGNVAKDELYGWLRLETPESPGFCHFPQYPEDYFKELTAEQLVGYKTRKGYIRTQWELLPGRVNHTLDARVYARCAAALAGLERLRDAEWAHLEDALGPAPALEVKAAPVEVKATSSPVPVTPAPAAPARRGWIQRRPGFLRGR